jgi:hypothetical protein
MIAINGSSDIACLVIAADHEEFLARCRADRLGNVSTDHTGPPGRSTELDNIK